MPHEKKGEDSLVNTVLYTILSVTDFVLFCIILGYALFIFIKYLVIQKKYTTPYLTAFYVNTVIVALANLNNLVFEVIAEWHPTVLDHWFFYLTTETDIWFDAFIGLLQIA